MKSLVHTGLYKKKLQIFNCWHKMKDKSQGGTSTIMSLDWPTKISKFLILKTIIDYQYVLCNLYIYLEWDLTFTSIMIFYRWCGPCKLLGPRLEAIISNREGKVSLAKVDVDENVEIAMEYAVKYLYMYSTVQAEILQFHVLKIYW